MPFPVAFDSTFPGYPYVDATEYIDATQANAWVAAIQAIEATIGYGTAGTPASPLYSSVYATTYTTITARMAAIESNISGGIKINTASGNIQPVGVSNTDSGTTCAAAIFCKRLDRSAKANEKAIPRLRASRSSFK